MVQLGIPCGSKPGPGSRTIISTPRSSSQATRHSTIFVGSSLAPWTTALAKASCSANSISSTLPLTQFTLRIESMTCATTGSTDWRCAASVTRMRKVSLSGSKSQPGKCSSEEAPDSMVGSPIPFGATADPWILAASGYSGNGRVVRFRRGNAKLYTSLLRIARRTHFLHAKFQLPPPIEFIDEPARLPPARFDFDVKLEIDFSPYHPLDLDPRGGADFLQHLAAFAHQDALLPFALAVNDRGNARELLAFLEVFHDHCGRIGKLF